MRKLLRSDFRRLFKSKFFWISSAFMFLFGLLPIDHWLSNREALADGYSEVMWHLEDSFFSYVVVLFFLITIMTILFIGSEYAGGTIRNKMIVGQKRANIYLSNLITLETAVILWSVLYVTVALSVGIPLLGMFVCGLPCAIAFMLLSLALSTTVTSIMLLIAMLFQNRTYAAILCLMLVFVLLLSGVVINSVLQEPEYYDGFAVLNTETGELMQEERMLNPNYVSGTKRQVLEETMDFLPGGQLIQICSLTVANPGKLALYDLLIFVFTTGMGMIFFKRKDIK